MSFPSLYELVPFVCVISPSMSYFPFYELFQYIWVISLCKKYFPLFEWSFFIWVISLCMSYLSLYELYPFVWVILNEWSFLVWVISLCRSYFPLYELSFLCTGCSSWSRSRRATTVGSPVMGAVWTSTKVNFDLKMLKLFQPLLYMYNSASCCIHSL